MIKASPRRGIVSQILHAHTRPVTAIAVDERRQLLISAGEDHHIIVFKIGQSAYMQILDIRCVFCVTYVSIYRSCVCVYVCVFTCACLRVRVYVCVFTCACLRVRMLYTNTKKYRNALLTHHLSFCSIVLWEKVYFGFLFFGVAEGSSTMLAQEHYGLFLTPPIMTFVDTEPFRKFSALIQWPQHFNGAVISSANDFDYL